jgi:hypothetical protein
MGGFRAVLSVLITDDDYPFVRLNHHSHGVKKFTEGVFDGFARIIVVNFTNAARAVLVATDVVWGSERTKMFQSELFGVFNPSAGLLRCE